MSDKKAFPKPDMEYPGGIQHGSEGMDLRDYFAAKAMQGMLSNPGWSDNAIDQVDDSTSLVNISYDIADAMIKAREL